MSVQLQAAATTLPGKKQHPLLWDCSHGRGCLFRGCRGPGLGKAPVGAFGLPCSVHHWWGAEAPAPASGGGQDAKAKAKTQNPRHGTIAFTSKTTPQASCGAYIKNAPCGFIPQGAGYMDLSAVFSLAAVKDGAGQGSTCSQHNRNPKSNIAVVAGLR